MAKVELKQPIVDEISAQVKDAASVVVVDARGLTVAQDTQLRKQLREAGVNYTVVKNSILERAAEEIGMKRSDIFLIEKGDVRVLYATDTGGIPSVAGRIAIIDPHVKQGKALTGLIMESTMGLDYDEDFRIFAHSSTATVLRTVHMLTKYGRYTPPEGQPVYITHMSRSLHDTPVDKNWPDIIKPAHDGLEVVFRAPV